MNRIDNVFARRRADNRCALVSFVTAGDPDANTTVDILHQLAAAGADILELGMPFSDPMADGPVIQRSSERALAAGMTLEGVFAIVRRFRQRDSDTPLVLMGYLNPIEQFGYRAFAAAADQHQVDGVITVDLPAEEGTQLYGVLDEYGIDPIFLIAPTTSDIRIQNIQRRARSFVYYVALKGVTGANTLNPKQVRKRLADIRTHLTLPIGVGFGIRDPQTAAQIAKFSDAVVIGTALVQRIEALRDQPQHIAPALARFVHELRQAMDQATDAAVG